MAKDAFDLNELKAAFGDLKRSATGGGGGGGGGAPGGPTIEARRGGGFPWAIVLPLIIVAWLLLQSFVVVGAGERAVIFNRFRGVQNGELGEGLHFLLPFVQYPTIYDVKTQTYTMSADKNESNSTIGNASDALTALTSDGLPVSLELSVQFHPDPAHIDRLHENIGPLYIDRVVRPQTRSHVRMVVSQYTVTDVYGARRAKIIEEINTRLRDLFKQNDIVLENALLRDVSFSPQFQQAIEEKQVAQQQVQRMTYVLDQADKERRRRIIEAEGEAQSIRLKARALASNPQLTQYEYVEGLPDNVRTVVTDNRTIINMNGMDNSTNQGSAAAVASETPNAPANNGGSQ